MGSEFGTGFNAGYFSQISSLQYYNNETSKLKANQRFYFRELFGFTDAYKLGMLF